MTCLTTTDIELMTVVLPTGPKQVRDMSRDELIEALRLAWGERNMWLKEARESLSPWHNGGRV